MLQNTQCYSHKATYLEAGRDAYKYHGFWWVKDPGCPADTMEWTTTSTYYDKAAKQFRIAKRTRDSAFHTPSNWFEPFMFHRVRGSKTGDGFCQGVFYSDEARTNNNVNYMKLIVFDLDDGHTFDGVVAMISRLGLDAVIFTTFSHLTDKGGVVGERMRVVLRLAEPFVMHEVEEAFGVKPTAVWKRMYMAIGAHVGLAPFDVACKDPARLHFMPACPSRMLSEARAVHIEGKPLSFRPFLEDGVHQVRREAEERLLRASERDDAEVSEVLSRAVEALNFISPDCDYLDWLRVILSFHSEFYGTESEDAAVAALNKWSSKARYKYDGIEPILRIWNGADEDGDVTLGTVFHLARESKLTSENRSAGVAPSILHRHLIMKGAASRTRARR